MTVSLTDDHVRQIRLRAQRLVRQSPETRSSVVRLVKELCGIQAQDTHAATLAVRVRSSGLVAADVHNARIQDRSVVRMWGLRGTLHLLPVEDLDWLLPLLGPPFIARDRRRRAELGLDEETCTRGIQIIRHVLTSQGSLTRDELVEQIATHGLRLVGQARPHLLSRAALEGVICFGPDRAGEQTYVLLSDWIGQEHARLSFSEIAAHAELTHRYLGAYGPATPHDQATWSGLPMSQTRAAWQHLADQLLEVEVAGSPAWLLKKDAARLNEQPASTPIVHLLPSFDPCLLGYQKRDLLVPPQYARRINAGGGMLHPTLLADGRAVGTWKSKQQQNYLQVQVEPFGQLAPEVSAQVETEVSDLARFLETKTWIAQEKSGGLLEASNPRNAQRDF
ncbi:MAG: winged helix DNA-binding domain-containing protein [Ktedonobacteraceae bacterium]